MNKLIKVKFNRLVDQSTPIEHKSRKIDPNIVFIGGDASQKQISIGPWSITVIRSSVVIQTNRKTVLDCSPNLHLFVPNSSDLKKPNTHNTSIINQIRKLITEVDEENSFNFTERFNELYNSFKNNDDGVDSCEEHTLNLSVHNLRPILEMAACIQFLKTDLGQLGEIYFFDGFIPGNEIDLFSKDSEQKYSETTKYNWLLGQKKIFAGVVKSGPLIDEAHYWREIIEDKHNCELLKLNDKVLQRLGKYLDDRERITISEADSTFPFEFYLLFSAGNVSPPCLIQVLKNEYFLENRETLYDCLIKNDVHQNTPMLSIPAVINAAHNASYFHDSEIVFLQKLLYNKLIERPESLLELYKFDLAKHKINKTRYVKKYNITGRSNAKKRAA